MTINIFDTLINNPFWYWGVSMSIMVFIVIVWYHGYSTGWRYARDYSEAELRG